MSFFWPSFLYFFILAVLPRLPCSLAPAFLSQWSCPSVPVPVFLSRLFCLDYPATTVLSQLSCSSILIPSTPILDAWSLLSCPGHPVISRLTCQANPSRLTLSGQSWPIVTSIVMFQMSFSDCAVMAVLTQLSKPSCPVPAVMFLLLCSGHHILSALSSLTFLSGNPVLAFQSRLSRPSCPVPAILLQLSCSSCPAPAVLPQPFLSTAFFVPAVLSLLSCSHRPVTLSIFHGLIWALTWFAWMKIIRQKISCHSSLKGDE